MTGGPEREAEEALREAREALSKARAAGGGSWEDAGNIAEDIEALRMVFKTLSDFIKDLGEPLERLVDVVLKALDGERLGSDVAGFYKKLRESGLPEELAVEMTREYFKARIRAVDVPSLVEELVKARKEAGGEG